MRIIPAIDIIEGKCVRLSQGLFESKIIYNEDPLEVAKMFVDYGLQYLHLVDLDGAKNKRIIHYKVLERIASKTPLQIDFGGGIASDEDVKIAFESGAKQITGGSIAVHKKDLFLQWLSRYGSDKIILGADFKNEKIVISGWEKETEESLISFVQSYKKEGIKNVISTDVTKDGMLEGSSLETYQELINATNLNIIASGGVASMDDLYQLKEIGCEGVIIGKAIYENKIDLKELSELC